MSWGCDNIINIITSIAHDHLIKMRLFLEGDQTNFIIFRGEESNSGIFRGGQSFLFTFRGVHDEIDLKGP